MATIDLDNLKRHAETFHRLILSEDDALSLIRRVERYEKALEARLSKHQDIKDDPEEWCYCDQCKEVREALKEEPDSVG